MQRETHRVFLNIVMKKKPAAAGTFGMAGYKEEGPESGPSIFIEVMKKLFYVIQH